MRRSQKVTRQTAFWYFSLKKHDCNVCSLKSRIKPQCSATVLWFKTPRKHDFLMEIHQRPCDCLINQRNHDGSQKFLCKWCLLILIHFNETNKNRLRRRMEQTRTGRHVAYDHSFLYFKVFFFNWSIVNLQCCVSHKYTEKWFGNSLFQILFHYRLL